MKILHLCSDYSNTSVYVKLVNQIAKCGLSEIIYVPISRKELIDKYRSSKFKNVEYHYSYILNLYTRINYIYKIKNIFNDIERKININQVNLIHAHFLFSDGGVALKLKKKYNINFIAAIRSTDINIFFKYFFYLHSKALEILDAASKIILITPSYKKQLLKYIPVSRRQNILDKIIIIPNGIDTFWLENINQEKKTIQEGYINLIYVGEYSYNKNIQTTIKVIKRLIKKGYKVKFKIIGEYGHYTKQILEITKNIPQIISYPKITDKKALLKHFRDNDIFIMPSFYETFGLVFLEAMSQGLPLIYTRNQGFDNYYSNGTVGYSVNPRNPDEIVNKIEKIIVNYQKISEQCLKMVKQFNLEYIVEKYINIYNESINDNI